MAKTFIADNNKDYTFTSAGFWMGAALYALINLFLSYYETSQARVELYNYLILCVALIGAIINYIFLKGKNDPQ